MKLLAIPLLVSSFVNASNCKVWFEKQKISADEKFCVDKCLSADVGMGTFSCPQECKTLCKNKERDVFFGILSLYPALTLKEREVCSLDKIKCTRAYYLSWRAENACKEELGRSITNDVSDACRHFLWAYFLESEMGGDYTHKILTAHEENPREPQNEKDMDQHNNKLGIEAAQKNKENANSNEKAVEIFRRYRSEKKLKILKGEK